MAAGRWIVQQQQASTAPAGTGDHNLLSDEEGSELFASVDSDGLPFLLRPADVPGAANATDEDGERNRLQMESVRQVCPYASLPNLDA